MAVSKGKIADNLRRIREAVAAACARRRRKEADVSIVAVTKSVGPETIDLLPGLGLTDLGESRVQPLLDRARRLRDRQAAGQAASAAPVRWHMIGHLQRNKVKALLPAVDVIHSVDSLRLAEDISLRAEAAGRPVDLLLQVNASEEPQKSGVAVGAAAHMSELISTLPNVRLIGLMTMAPVVRDMEDARPTFVRIRELFEEMRHERLGGPAFRHLSMGMSQDYPVAVEEGATMLRIGTALFE